MEQPGWTDQKVSLLKQGWLAGKGAGELVGVLAGEFSRVDIILKLDELKLARANPPKAAARRAPKPCSSAVVGLWSDEKEKELEGLCAEGLTASEIAAQLGGGISRNAVIGKVLRKGWHLSGSAGPRIARSRKPRAPRVHAPKIAPDEPVIAPEDATNFWQPSEGEGVTFSDKKMFKDCGWPIDKIGTDGITMFCGAASNGNIYCPWHHKIHRRSA